MNLQQQIQSLSSLTDVSIDREVKLADGNSAKDIFCASWPVAKRVLEAVAAMNKNPVVKAVILIIVTVGEGFESTICHEN